MTTTDLRITETDWIALRKHLAGSFRSPQAPEAGVIGVVGECRAGGRHEFTVARMLWPGPDDLKVAENRALVFDARYIRRAHLLMRSEGLAGLVMFHSHPMSDTLVGFSVYDDHQEPQLIANLREIAPATQLVSVVASKRAQCGRVWTGHSGPEALGRLITLGETLGFHALSGEPEPAASPPAAIFDRALALTGAGALARLSQMTVAVVGASGTGSLVCELLARAGCKSLMVIDHDVTADVNLNRILYSTQRDADERSPKVEVLHRGIEGLGLGCRVEAINGNILDSNVLAHLREADVIFGCVDKAYPRLLLSQFAYQYLRPYIDVGAEIGANTKGIVALNARTNYVAPGRPCLMCTGLVTPRQLRFESLGQEERQRVAWQGYSDDLILDQPAVMDLNMHAAAYGVMLLRHLLQPFLLTPLPATISENLATFTTLAVKDRRAPTANCRICQDNPKAGFADCGPVLGMGGSEVKRLMGGI